MSAAIIALWLRVWVRSLSEGSQSLRAERIDALRHPRPASLRSRRFNFVAILISHALPTAGVLLVAYNMIWRHVFPSALDLTLCFTFYFFTLLGLEIGYHRYFTHDAFKTSKFFERVLAFLGSITFEGGVIWWTGTHKRHHAFSDEDGDPHSPHYQHNGGIRGFVYAHLGWLFNPGNTNLGPWVQHVTPMYQDPYLSWLNRNYFTLSLVFLLLPAAIGFAIGGSIEVAWSAFIWGGLVRVFLVTHAIFSINSVCHMFGSKPFKQPGDHSRNSAWLALYTLGASWHNNHHAFPRTATNQLQWWQLDIAGSVIWFLEKLGVVWDVWRPTMKQIEIRSGRDAV